MKIASHCEGIRRLVARLLTFCMLIFGSISPLRRASAEDGTKTVDAPGGGTVTTTTKGKTVHVVKKNADNAKTEESLSVTEKKKVITGTEADAVGGAKTVTTTTTTKYKLVHQLPTPTSTTTTVVDKFGNPISEEVQIWDKEGDQTGGHFKQGKDGKPQAFDPKTKTYADGTKPTNDKPPTYPEPGTDTEKPEKPKKPAKSKGASKAKSKGGDRDANNFFNTGASSHELKYGAGYRGAEVADSDWRPRGMSDEEYQEWLAQTHGFKRDLNAYLAARTGVPGSPEEQLFPTGFECGVSFDFIFSADPIFHTETHTETVRYRFFTVEEVVVGHELVDADGIPGGADIEVPIFDERRVSHIGKRKVKVKTKEDVSVVSDDDIGGNLNVHYWCNPFFGVGASNAVLSAPDGIVDILGVRGEARLPFVVPLNGTHIGIAPFVYLGCSGTFGENDDFFGLDIGGGVQLRTTSGFNISVEAGADLNGEQNYGIGSVNFGWHKALP